MFRGDRPLYCRNCSAQVKELNVSRLCVRCGASLLEVGLGPLSRWRPADLSAWLLRSNLAMTCGVAFLVLCVEMVFASSALHTGWLNTHLSLAFLVAGFVVLFIAQRRIEGTPTSNCGRCGNDVSESGTECLGCGADLGRVGIAVREACIKRNRWAFAGGALIVLPILIYTMNILIALKFGS